MVRYLGTCVFALLGLLLTIGGGWLLSLGGSIYYLAAGLVLLAIAVLIWLRDSRASLLYGGLLIVTIVWSLFESGLDPWALMPRLAMLSIAGLWFAFPFVWRAYRFPAAGVSRWRLAATRYCTLGLFFCVVVLMSAAFWRIRYVPLADPKENYAANTASLDWTHFGGDNRGERFSPATQIDAANIDKLQVAWTYRYNRPNSPQAVGSFTFQATPLKIGDSLYLCTPVNEVVSLDADTGKERWRFNPKTDMSKIPHAACRGVSYFAGTGSGAMCDARIYVATADDRLIAMDRNSGRPCEDFGTRSVVNLAANIGQAYPGNHYTTSPPVVIGNAIVVNAMVLDNQSNDSPPGVIRAYDVRSGKPLWGWDLISDVGQKDLGSGDIYARNSPNSWSVMSADDKLGLIYVPTGNAPPDYYGGTRPKAQERYNTSVVALDAATGNVRWRYETVHHDLWDMDVPAQPVVIDIDTARGKVPALVVPTKRGEIFVLDRRTGKPVFPVEERPVPAGNLPGEHYARTQPYPTDFSFGAPKLKESDMWGATPFDQMLCRITFRQHRYQGQFTPPGTDTSIAYPGLTGFINWGSVAIDPERQIMFVNTSNMPVLLKLLPRTVVTRMGLRPYGEPIPPGTKATPAWSDEGSGVFEGIGARALYPQQGVAYGAEASPFLSRFGFPCAKPSWGDVAAVDLRTRRILWQRPFGTTRDAAPFGIALPTGVPNTGGAVVTRSGVAFIGAAIDDYLRAYDIRTGKELWRGRLPAGGQASPMTYVSPKTGRQYVVIAAGGHTSLRTKLGDYVVAFALPAKR